MYKKCALHSANRRQTWQWQNRGDGGLFSTGRILGIKQPPSRGHSGSSGCTGITTTTAVCWESVAFKLRQTTTNPTTDGAAAAACCEGLNTTNRHRSNIQSTHKMCFSSKRAGWVFFFFFKPFNARFSSYISKLLQQQNVNLGKQTLNPGILWNRLFKNNYLFAQVIWE